MRIPSLTPALAAVVASMAAVGHASAQQDTASADLSDVRLFQSYFADARVTDRPYFGGEPSFSSFDGADLLQFYARGGYTVIPQLEVEGQLGYRRIGPDGADPASGVTDLMLTGRYVFPDTMAYDIAAGAYFDLPIGDESIGGGAFDFGFYGALRLPVSDRVIVTGTLGLDFVKNGPTTGGVVVCYPPPPIPAPGPLPPFPLCFPTPGTEGERVTSINLGGGAIVRTAEEGLSVVGELRFEPEFDYAALSGGLDYVVPGLGHLRGALVLGLDDGSPDFALLAQLVRVFP